MTKAMTQILTYLVLGAVAVTMLVPFLWMVSTSLMTELEVYQFPPRFVPREIQWKNYPDALTILPFNRFFLNSLIITAGAVVGQLLFCSMAAYAFSRLRFRGRNKLFAVYLMTIMIPAIVTMIPAFLIIHAFGWINTYWAMITPAVISVWGIFLLRQFFMTLPRDLEDAARMDGAGDFTIYWKIVLPLSKPALATLAIFSFMGMWKDFLWPLIVTTRMEMRPVEVGIAMFHTIHSLHWPHQMAAAVTVMIPIILVFFFAQKYFIRGITLTGMKG